MKNFILTTISIFYAAVIAFVIIGDYRERHPQQPKAKQFGQMKFGENHGNHSRPNQ